MGEGTVRRQGSIPISSLVHFGISYGDCPSLFKQLVLYSGRFLTQQCPSGTLLWTVSKSFAVLWEMRGQCHEVPTSLM